MFELQHDSESPLQLEGSKLPQNAPAYINLSSQPKPSEVPHSSQGAKPLGDREYKSGKHTYMEERHRRVRDTSKDSHRRCGLKKNKSKGSEVKDCENLKQIQQILATALIDLKSEHTSKKDKDLSSKA